MAELEFANYSGSEHSRFSKRGTPLVVNLYVETLRGITAWRFSSGDLHWSFDAPRSLNFKRIWRPYKNYDRAVQFGRSKLMNYQLKLHIEHFEVFEAVKLAFSANQREQSKRN